MPHFPHLLNGGNSTHQKIVGLLTEFLQWFLGHGKNYMSVTTAISSGK